MYYPCSENKGADQLRGYYEADLRLCFRIGKNPVFLQRGSFVIVCLEQISAASCEILFLYENISFMVILLLGLYNPLFYRTWVGGGSRWPSGRALDSEPKVPGFDLHLGCHVVSLFKTYKLLRLMVNTQEVST